MKIIHLKLSRFTGHTAAVVAVENSCYMRIDAADKMAEEVAYFRSHNAAVEGGKMDMSVAVVVVAGIAVAEMTGMKIASGFATVIETVVGLDSMSPVAGNVQTVNGVVEDNCIVNNCKKNEASGIPDTVMKEEEVATGWAAVEKTLALLEEEAVVAVAAMNSYWSNKDENIDQMEEELGAETSGNRLHLRPDIVDNIDCYHCCMTEQGHYYYCPW